MALNHHQKLAAARVVANQKAPFFSRAIVSLIPVEKPELGTFAVSDDYRLFWAGSAVDQWTVEEIAAVLLHEVCHLLREHFARANTISAMDRTVWNVAADCEINDDLVLMGLKLPNFKDEQGQFVSGPHLPSNYKMADGLSAEAYYAQLMQDQPEIHPSTAQCGSGAGNPTEEDPGTGGNQPKDDADGGEGSTPGRTPMDVARIKMQVAEDIKQSSQGRGKAPGGWNAWADGMLKPSKIRWQDKLRRIVRGQVTSQAGLVDYTYARNSRRQAGLGYGVGSPIMPAMVAPIPIVAIGLDTSGSMGAVGLAEAVSEIEAIMKSIRASVDLIACDCQVHGQKKVTTFQDLLRTVSSKDFGGGGGTDFRPVFAAVEKLKVKPNVFIFLTDGDGPAPAAPPPGVNVIWVIVGRYRDTRPASWGEIVVVDSDS